MQTHVYICLGGGGGGGLAIFLSFAIRSYVQKEEINKIIIWMDVQLHCSMRKLQELKTKQKCHIDCGWTYLDVCFVPFHKSVRMEEKCHEQLKLKWGLSACSLLFIWITLNPSDLNGFEIKIVSKTARAPLPLDVTVNYNRNCANPSALKRIELVFSFSIWFCGQFGVTNITTNNKKQINIILLLLIFMRNAISLTTIWSEIWNS